MTINELLGLIEEAEGNGLLTVLDIEALEQWLFEQGYAYERAKESR